MSDANQPIQSNSKPPSLAKDYCSKDYWRVTEGEKLSIRQGVTDMKVLFIILVGRHFENPLAREATVNSKSISFFYFEKIKTFNNSFCVVKSQRQPGEIN